MKLIDRLPTDHQPVVPLMGYPGVAAAGSTAKAALTEPAAHLESMMLLEKRFRPDALFMIMDLTVEAEALGLEVTFEGGGPPSVVSHPVDDSDKLTRLKVPDPRESGRMPLFLEVAGSVKGKLSGMLGAYCIGPFTLAAELAGPEDLAIKTITEPDFARAAVDFAAEVGCAYSRALVEAGADVVAILEPTAVMLSPATFEQFCAGPLERLGATVRSEGGCPVLHICGDSTHLFAQMASCGMDGLSLDHPVDLADAFEAVGRDTVVIGNIDPVGVMMEGDPESVWLGASALLARFGGLPNFVLGTGCDLPGDTPLENIDALMAAR
ncbi:MAG TPA: uroporphyrinogen decarboxylase family protein [Candidatus Anoxymicrobiaceae bacterium]